MPSSELLQLSIIVLSALSMGGVVYVLVSPYFSDERKVDKRVANAGQGPARVRAALQAQPLQMRKKQVQDTIKDIEAKERAKKWINLRTKIMRAGLSISTRTYYIICAATGLLCGLIILATGSSLLVSLLAAIGSGFWLPRWFVSRSTKRRQAKFLLEFANAVDIIVRGVKTGLPLNDCLQIISVEAPEPVRSEFINLVEQQRVGVPLQRAFERMFDRMPLQEVNFFAIVVAIQSQTGGNLAETLANLSQVLRDRHRLAAKVQAFSAEAKASAKIIGALPIAIMFLVYIFNPDYILVLWTEKIGQILLIASAIWMLLGVLVMRKMIKFDY